MFKQLWHVLFGHPWRLDTDLPNIYRTRFRITRNTNMTIWVRYNRCRCGLLRQTTRFRTTRNTNMTIWSMFPERTTEDIISDYIERFSRMPVYQEPLPMSLQETIK